MKIEMNEEAMITTVVVAICVAAVLRAWILHEPQCKCEHPAPPTERRVP